VGGAIRSGAPEPVGEQAVLAQREALQADRAARAVAAKVLQSLPVVFMPASRSFRHAARCEEYSPSRRRIAPTSPLRPEETACSTSLRMRCLSFAVNPRRFAFATTSVSLTEGIPTTWFIASALVALDTKLPCQDCLIHIGRAGRAVIRQPHEVLATDCAAAAPGSDGTVLFGTP
jgi:hypothetical protein